MDTQSPLIDWNRTDLLISMALDEDLGTLGDTTTLSVIPSYVRAAAVLIAKEDIVCAGLDIAKRVFLTVDSQLLWEANVKEGQFVKKGTILAKAVGNATSILTAERTVLNFLQRLSGIASTANRYQAAVAPNSKTRILDTRKTTPAWRNLEKYAVSIGGATNHRIGLYDRIMIKDNHREIAGFEGSGAISRAVTRAREAYPQLEIQVEVDTLEQLKEALECGVDFILLDNMDDKMTEEAVKITAGRCKLEASGGITLERITLLSKLGVDFISVGALTHSVKSADISLDVLPLK